MKWTLALVAGATSVLAQYPNATTTAAAASSSNPVPPCWSSCFGQEGVTSESSLCTEPLKSAVEGCIASSCSNTSSIYDAWLSKYCASASSSTLAPTGYTTGSIPTSSGYRPYPLSNSTDPVGPTGTGISTDCTTTYSSVCTETSTLIYRSTTALTCTTITHTLTTTIPGSCPATISVPTSTGTAVGPTTGAPSPTDGGSDGTSTVDVSTVVTDYTTIFTTVYPVTSTATDGGATYTTSSVSTVTSVIETTITVSADGGSPTGGYGGSWPTGTWPADPSNGGYGGSWPTGTWPADPSDEPTRTPGEVYSTVYMTSYTSMNPVSELPYTYQSWSSVYTSYEVSTITDYITTTVTHPSDPTSTGAYPTGTGWYPTGGSPTWGYPSGSGYPAPSGTGASYPTGTGSSGCVPCQGNPGNDPETFCGYDIYTNWYYNIPNTCKTVEYTFDLTEETISPDGRDRIGFLVNGQMPGPAIEASWGDTIVVHVTNNLPASIGNGTTFHWHGIHQNYTNEMDGVSSITQCPIAPGESYTYKFRASSYGSSWWHAHYALQTYEGIFGPINIKGPLLNTTTYDDEQNIILQDWSQRTADQIYEPAGLAIPANQRGVTLDNGLINGKGVWGNGTTQTGEYFSMTVESGKKYRLRVLNAAIQSTFKFYVDSHTFTVIAADFVPIQPYETNAITINIGQRYDIILEANQPASDYWIRSDNIQLCGSLIDPDIKGILHYTGHTSTPTSTAYGYQPACVDEPLASLVPIVPWSAGAQSSTIDETVVIAPNGEQPNLYKWTLSGTTFQSQWGNPTLEQIVENGTIPDYSGNLAISVPDLGEWVYVIIDTPIPVIHPIHLHGHDFLILAQDTGAYSSSVALNLDNPPRRDVAVMPADPINNVGGYLVIAFYTMNPGVWLLHCHIGWHNSMGFALQIIENLEGIAETVKYKSQLEDTCSTWNAYANPLGDTAAAAEDSGV